MRHLAWIPALAVLRHHHKYSKKHKKTATQQANAHHVALILAANYVYFSEASPPHTKRGLPSPPSSVSLSHQFLWGKRDSNNTVPSTKYKHPPSFGSSRLCQSSDEWESATPPRAPLPGATSATLDRSRRPLREIKTRAASGKCQPASRRPPSAHPPSGNANGASLTFRPDPSNWRSYSKCFRPCLERN